MSSWKTGLCEETQVMHSQPAGLWLLTICSQDKSRDDRNYGYSHNLFNLYFSLFSLITLSIIQVVWEGEYLH